MAPIGRLVPLVETVTLNYKRVTPTDITLHGSAQNGYLDIFKLLMEDGRLDPSSEDNIAIFIAAQSGHSEIVKLLLQDPQVDPSTSENRALGAACQNGHTKVVELLLTAARVDPTNPFKAACRCGHAEVVKLLLKDGRTDLYPRINPRAQDNIAIIAASQKNHVGVLDLLLKDGRADAATLLLQTGKVDPSARDQLPVRAAAQNNHFDVIELLVEDQPLTASVVLLAAATAYIANKEVNAANKQVSTVEIKGPWAFAIIHTREMKAEIRQIIEHEEKINYESRMSRQWVSDLAKLRTNWEKEYLELAPYLIIVFKQAYGIDQNGKRINHYYYEQSNSIACGILITALHNARLYSSDAGPAIRGILGRPANEKVQLLLPVGYPAKDATVPDLKRKAQKDVVFGV
ncbi:UNVERIFIED_CONTAM: hypothetical protein HDU68_010284 [Siphonaria sp. JEL0065]|nr:hypothetical protein HDU68_010284 [Siphonaria sp. JEL0065]